MSKYKNIKSEHQLRALVFDDYFKRKDISWEQEITKIDFVITDTKSRKEGDTGAKKHYVWMETKNKVTDQYIMLTQLLLTIKNPYDKNEYIVPNYVGCFDTEKIIFVPMKLFQNILHDNDINWKTTPSDKTKDNNFFKIINKLKEVLFNNNDVKIFTYGNNDEELKDFIDKNIYKGITENIIEIKGHNFDRVYLKWLEKVKPSIVIDWEEAKKIVLEGDFFLADLLSRDDVSIKEGLSIVLQHDHYKLTKLKESKIFVDDKYYFKDKQKAYKEFWSIYKRPPSSEYWDYIIGRKDLLVPQDIRERRGSFFTPQIWVEKSQEYIADVLGEDWQDEYYVWDCCAGTGNLLVGINRKIENVFASTIDQSDVKVMHDRIDNGARLLKRNVFQFDFLNDDFKKLPKALKDIINEDEKRKKLIIYINPPYAEAMNRTDATKAKTDVNRTTTEKEYVKIVGKSIRELFIQILIRIYKEIPGCIIANFSKLKNLQSPNFENFREIFKPKLEKIFLVPAYTFDNVKGKFPIGFHIWDTKKRKTFKEVEADVYNKDGDYIGKKKIYSYSGYKYLNDWLKQYVDITPKEKNPLAMCCKGNDFQNNIFVNINFNNAIKGIGNAKGIARFIITENNIIEASIYFAVRNVIKADWLNDRDQFLFPNDGWKYDTEFQNDCLTYTLFNTNIQSKYGVNHWIPFTEKEVNAKSNFKSNFMSDFINGKIKIEKKKELFENKSIHIKGKLKFSKEAQAVYDAGRELWKYYNSIQGVNVDASLYDIKMFFQGVKDGRMNNKSNDEEYNRLIGTLRDNIKILAKKIEPKVYEYGFLK